MTIPTMTQRNNADELGELHVIFTAAAHLFAVSHAAVEQMVTLPAIVRVPNTHPAVRGVINLRGAVIGLVDLRLAIGQRSVAADRDALLASLAGYASDHHAWLAELAAAVDAGARFHGETHAAGCPFGRFLEEQAAAGTIAHRVGPFERPHTELHAAGAEVDQLVAHGDLAGARARVEGLRNTTMFRLDRLFADAAELAGETHRDIALVLRQAGNSPLAVQVDGVETVDHLVAADGPDLDGLNIGGLVSSIARDAGGRLVSVLDPSHIFRLVAA
ncbi:MAG: hypothetical protein CVU56_07910 [Deltaproteobacteria bacterium HGW-Deltaproteobacteria-14]|jgi:chemotaxis signal transduction protein|nr:MAG: hypothetical protein CVU56_07910 [Deltaproteobacteria bacterium HGW-Deltaproteobacteria-14]